MNNFLAPNSEIDEGEKTEEEEKEGRKEMEGSGVTMTGSTSSGDGSMTTSICTEVNRRSPTTRKPMEDDDDIRVYDVPNSPRHGREIEHITLIHGTQKALELLKNIKDKSVKQNVANNESPAATCNYFLDMFLAARIPIHDIPSRGCELGTRWMKYPMDGISCLDHRLKLYLDVKVFNHEDEEPRVIARGEVWCSKLTSLQQSLLVLSTHRLYVLAVTQFESDEPEQWLRLTDSFLKEEVRGVSGMVGDQGLIIFTSSIYLLFLIKDSGTSTRVISAFTGTAAKCLTGKPPVSILLKHPVAYKPEVPSVWNTEICGGIMQVRCRVCRSPLLDSSTTNILTAHGEAAHEFSSCSTLILYLQDDHLLPDWVLETLNQGEWRKGNLKCPRCSTRIGGFDFITGNKCTCGTYLLPPVYVVKSKVDLQ
ncbi:unnamed protein product [Darwinula stevensoni]|uniref:PLEKHM2 PH domain-containing protein n=1 Tax=Darwinula stevensoni TaxID=69355 RepID=A0A7R9A4U4_9CRUS|nr:unnamed protein product [Darwinula stevensoni]CAG0893238.1 unnamed protein product [Darwinula stevensoni]